MRLNISLILSFSVIVITAWDDNNGTRMVIYGKFFEKWTTTTQIKCESRCNKTRPSHRKKILWFPQGSKVNITLPTKHESIWESHVDTAEYVFYESGKVACIDENDHSNDVYDEVIMLPSNKRYREVGIGSNGFICGKISIGLVYDYRPPYVMLVNNVETKFKIVSSIPINITMTSEYNSGVDNRWELLDSSTGFHTKIVLTTKVGDYLFQMSTTCDDGHTDHWSYNVSVANATIEKFHLNVTSDMQDEVEVEIGGSISFSCNNRGNNGAYDILYLWKKDGVQMNLSSNKSVRIHVEQNSKTLHIKSIKHTDVGIYTCIVTDAVELFEKSAYLSIKKKTEKINEGSSIYANFAISILVITLAMTVILFLLKHKKVVGYNRHIKEKLKNLQKYHLSGLQHDKQYSFPLKQYVAKLSETSFSESNVARYIISTPYDICLEIEKKHFTEICELGSGNFGKVMKGVLQHYNGQEACINVAIKVVKDTTDENQFKSLIYEIKILSYVGHHENIIHLYGASTTNIKKGQMYLIYELCENGNLKDFLSKSTYLNEEIRVNGYVVVPLGSTVTVSSMLRFCYEICDGMEYLTQKNVLHRDLAARNVLLTSDMTIKLCDFGLARNLLNGYRYNISSDTSLPIKWMAVESIKNQTYTTKSDVWSFGICCWEIFSKGADPYFEYNIQILADLIVSGRRLSQPKYATSEIFKIMENCWNVDPKERPTFTELVEIFCGLIHGIN